MSDTTTTPTIHWTGASGKTYKYWIYPRGTKLKEEAGNYIHAKETSPGRWTPVYIGQSGNLNDRLKDEYKRACVDRNGATHIHAHLNSNEDARLAEEKDLILKWQPPCNSQHVS